jgi:hypothetical protein
MLATDRPIHPAITRHEVGWLHWAVMRWAGTVDQYAPR